MNFGDQEQENELLPQVSKNSSFIVTTANVAILQNILRVRQTGLWYEKGKEQKQLANYEKAEYFFRKELNYNNTHWKSHLQLAHVYALSSLNAFPSNERNGWAKNNCLEIENFQCYTHLVTSLENYSDEINGFIAELTNHEWSQICKLFEIIHEAEVSNQNNTIGLFIAKYALGIDRTTIENIKKWIAIPHHNQWIIYYLCGIWCCNKYEFFISTDDEMAIEYLDLALKLKPDLYEALYYRALSKSQFINPHTYQKDYVGAIKDFDSLIKFKPQHINSYYQRALCKFNIKDYNSSIQDCTSVINLDNNYTDAYIIRAKANYSLKEYDLCIADCTIIISTNYDSICKYP
jgi:tetratricopeptide (TPR) repeat protein